MNAHGAAESIICGSSFKGELFHFHLLPKELKKDVPLF
jgi:hypothetical protein